MINGAFIGYEIVDLVLREEPCRKARGKLQRTAFRFQATGDEFGKCRFTIAVGSEKGDAVVIVEPEVHILEDRLAHRIADSTILDDNHR